MRRSGLLKSWFAIFIFTLLNFPEGTLFNRVNPIRAGIVVNLEELNKYPYSGHTTLVGSKERPWQDVDYVPGHFGRMVHRARKAYLGYVEAGLGQGHRDELTGGGLIRIGGKSAQIPCDWGQAMIIGSDPLFMVMHFHGSVTQKNIFSLPAAIHHMIPGIAIFYC